jgi:6-phosphogluconolactonase
MNDNPIGKNMNLLIKTTLIALLYSFSVLAYAQEHFLYVGLSEKLIALYKMDIETGDLKFVENQTSTDLPYTMTKNHSQTALYISLRGSLKRGVASYSINQDNGRLTLMNELELTTGPVHLSVDKTENYFTTSAFFQPIVTINELNDDGSFKLPTTEIATSKNPHMLITDNANKFAYIPCLRADLIEIYQFDQTSGQLSPEKPEIFTLPKGFGPRWMEFHPSKNFVYLGNEFGNSVTALSIDPSNGKLAEINTLSSVPVGITERVFSSEVHLSPDNKFVYIANRGKENSSITAFKIDPLTGGITKAGYFRTEAEWPLSFVISENGKFMYVGGKNTGNLEVFSINTTSGALTHKETLKLASNPFSLIGITL